MGSLNGIFQILNPDNTLNVNRHLAMAIGLNATVVYSALIKKFTYYEKAKRLEEGMFFTTVEDLRKSTSLSKGEQQRAIKVLIENELIEVEYRGLPRKRYIKVNNQIDQLERLINRGMEELGEIDEESIVESKQNQQWAQYAPSGGSKTRPQEETFYSDCSEQNVSNSGRRIIQQEDMDYACMQIQNEPTVGHDIIQLEEPNQFVNQKIRNFNEKKEKLINHKLNQSIEEANVEKQKVMELIDYNTLKKLSDSNMISVRDLDTCVQVIADVNYYTASEIQISGYVHNTDKVKMAFKGITSSVAEKALKRVAAQRNKGEINNPYPYILTALYKELLDTSYDTNQIKYRNEFVKVNQFNDYPQREYTKEQSTEIERRWMERGRKEKYNEEEFRARLRAGGVKKAD